MKRFTIAMIAVVVLMLASDSPVSAASHPCQSAFVTIGCMNWRLQEYDERIEALEEAIDLLGTREQVEADIENLETQIVNRSNALTSVRQSLSQAQSELSRVIVKTQWLDTAYGVITTRRFTSCGSMEPYIYSDSLVFVLNDPPASIIERGDVVGSSNPSCQFTHRIIGGSAVDGWIVKGDNRHTADNCRVMNDQILFRVEYVVRGYYS